MIAVANRIKELLDSQGKSAYWLAKQTGISTQSIYNIINSDLNIDEMQYRTVRRIASALGVSPEELRAERPN
jgi:transcriptional regulator with XRE-family HTH domain